MIKYIFCILFLFILINGCREFDSDVRINQTDQSGVLELISINNQFRDEIFSIAQLTPTALLAGSDSGRIFKISPSTGTVELYSSYEGSGYIIAVQPADSSVVVLLNSNSEVGISKNGGLSWTNWSGNFGPKIILTLYYYFSTQYFYIGTTDGLIYKRSLADTNWSPVTNLYRPVTSFTSPDSISLYAGTWSSGIFKINLGTKLIEGVNSGLLNPYIQMLHAGRNNKLFAATYGSGVFCSSNNGISWSNYSNIIDTCKIIHISTNSNNDLIATTNAELYIIKNNPTLYSNGIFYSSDILINTLLVDINDNIYIGANNGVFRANQR